MLPAAKPQRYNPGNVGFVRAGNDTPKNDFVEIFRLKRLSHEQGSAGGHGKIGGSERPRLAPSLQKWGAAAIHDVNSPTGFVRSSAIHENPSPFILP
jgi:hypothetical protein